MLEAIKIQYKRLDYLNVLLLLSVLFAAASRMYGLDARGFWRDELFSLSHSRPSFSFTALIENLGIDIHNPNLHYIFLWLWSKLWGTGLWELRLSSALMSILSLVPVYYLAKECYNKKTAVYAVFITAITLQHIAMAQELRSYAMLYLFSAINWYFFYLVTTRKSAKQRLYLFYSLSGLCLIHVHYYAYALIPAQAVFLFWRYCSRSIDRKRFLLVCLSLLCIVSGSALSWPNLLFANSLNTFWIAEKSWGQKLFYFFSFFDWAFAKEGLIHALFIYKGLFFWACYKNLVSLFQEKTAAASILLLWLCFGFAVPIIYSIFRFNVLLPKYFLANLAPVQILIAQGLAGISPRLAGILTFLLYAAVLLYLIRSDIYGTQFLG